MIQSAMERGDITMALSLTLEEFIQRIDKRQAQIKMFNADTEEIKDKLKDLPPLITKHEAGKDTAINVDLSPVVGAYCTQFLAYVLDIVYRED